MEMEDAQPNGEPAIFSYFDLLPDDVVLLIFEYIHDFKDMCTLRRINKRLSVIAGDKTLAVDYIDCREQYWLSADLCEDFIRPYAEYMQYINLDNCYWLKSIDANIFLECTRLRSLHLIQIDILARTLCQILSNQSKLTSLSISIFDIEDFHVQLAASPGAQECLRNVVELKLHFSNRLYHGHQPVIDFNKLPTLFQYCRDIKEIHFYGNTNSVKSVTRSIMLPEVLQVSNLRNVQVMTLKADMDPAARHLFFEILRRVCTSRILLSTLLVHSSNDDQFWREEFHRDAMRYGQDLVHLDASGVRMNTTVSLFGFETTPLLNYLNASGNDRMNTYCMGQLVYNCRYLKCLNLENCTHVIRKTPHLYWDLRFNQAKDVDTSGIQSLILGCLRLRSLNLSGIHIHPNYMRSSFYKNLSSLLSTNTKWKSLSLPSCSLFTYHTCQSKPDETTQDPNVNATCRRCRLLNVNFSDPMSLLKRPDSEQESDFEKLVRQTPDLEHFELISTGFTSVFSKTFGIQPASFARKPCLASLYVDDTTLIDVFNWKNLKSLQLTAIEGIHLGYCLWTIAHGCKHLERLYLSCLGSLSHCSYVNWLVKSMPLFSRLRDFRLEQPRLEVGDTLLEAIGKCPCLQRICIIADCGTFSSIGMRWLFVSLPNLINFQLYTGDCVEKCQELRDFLLEQYLESRPALSVCIYPLLDSNLQEVVARDVPDQHFDEMTILKSTVAIRPIDG